MADELGEELGTGVAVWSRGVSARLLLMGKEEREGEIHVPRSQNFICEFGACFKGEGFRQDEGVVAVEQEGCDLGVIGLAVCC